MENPTVLKLKIRDLRMLAEGDVADYIMREFRIAGFNPAPEVEDLEWKTEGHDPEEGIPLYIIFRFKDGKQREPNRTH